MKRVKIWAGILLALFVLNCSKDELHPYKQNVIGTWRLFEYGISPGSGYFVTEISEKPPQLLTFTKRGELIRQGTQAQMEYFFDGYNRYRLVSKQRGISLVFSKKGKDDSEYRYRLSTQNDTLTILPYCAEGCHFGFVRVGEK
ncbi:hypothetical protein [Telluribacter sp.]|jgi:hypothetical protein|uniref:hypothetical protein n=1 Tax=Telluribacter sp. TaxID=1978767 RepID=UPI002E14A559|nr:hypothetical protein [Telluribacter sp.]